MERDRLRTGISQAVIVIETDINGGTMQTAKFTVEQNRILGVVSPLINYKGKAVELYGE